MYSIKVEGKAAHAGLEPEKGASAILELARQTERLHSINQSGSGITLNLGVVRGGTRSNVVAAEAEGEIDVRFTTESEANQIEQLLKTLKPITTGRGFLCRVESTVLPLSGHLKLSRCLKQPGASEQ